MRRWLSLGVVCAIAWACSTFEDAPGGGGPDAGIDSGLGSDGAPADGPVGPAEVVALATGIDLVTGVAVSMDEVYWAEVGQGRVRGTTLDGKLRAFDMTSSAKSPKNVAFRNNTVFWNDNDSNGTIRSVRRGALPVEVTVFRGDVATPAVAVTGLAVSDTRVFCALLANGGGTQGGVRHSALDGSDPKIFTGNNTFIGVAAIGTGAFACHSSEGIIYEIANDGSAVKVAPSELDCRDVAATSGAVYWTLGIGGQNRVRGMLKGGTPFDIASELNVPRGIVADDTAVYWINEGGELRRWKASDAKVVTVATGIRSSSDFTIKAIALHPSYVLVADYGSTGKDGRILRVSR